MRLNISLAHKLWRRDFHLFVDIKIERSLRLDNHDNFLQRSPDWEHLKSTICNYILLDIWSYIVLGWLYTTNQTRGILCSSQRKENHQNKGLPLHLHRDFLHNSTHQHALKSWLPHTNHLLYPTDLRDHRHSDVQRAIPHLHRLCDNQHQTLRRRKWPQVQQPLPRD